MANEYDDIEWETLYKKLWVYARSLKRTWGVDDTFDSGLSEEDIVSETLVLFWESKNRLGWKSNRGATLGTYMCTVLRNKFIDHLREDKQSGRLDGRRKCCSHPIRKRTRSVDKCEIQEPREGLVRSSRRGCRYAGTSSSRRN